MGDNKKIIIDHIDRNGLNNTRKNLRICTHAQNKANLHLYRNNTSGFRGVTFDKNRNKWFAKIRKNDKWIFIGRFDKKIDAAIAYQKKAKEFFGDFVFNIDAEINLKEVKQNGRN
jgi:hypothetical protein